MDSSSLYYYTWHGRIVSTPEELQAARLSGVPLRAWPRLLGGKGGFGSLLRSIGSQIDKTTNREMCRDLSGRRMRDVNNQKRLAEWAAGAGARAAERQKRREEKRRKRRDLLESADGPAGHVMEDGRYLDEKERIVDSVFSAVQDAVKSRKRPAGEASAASTSSASASASTGAAGPSRGPKAVRKWLEADLEGLESSSSSSTSGSGGDSDSDSDPGFAPVAADPNQGGEGASNGDPDTDPQPHQSVDEKEQQQKEAAEKSNQTNKEDSNPQEKKQQADAIPDELFDLASLDSLEAAEALGLDALKSQLRMRGLKCSGSLRERAQRLMAVRGLTPEQYPRALLAPQQQQQQRK